MPRKTKSEPEPKHLLRENARLRADLLTIGGRVSHDMLAPVGSILISIQLLKETLKNDDQSLALAMESLSSSADELKQIIESVSMLAKATARPLPKEPVDMGEVVVKILHQSNKQISKLGATVGAPDSWPQVEGVPGWLEMVWRHFLNHALQRGGSKIQLGWRRGKAEFRFWVSDDGARLPDEETPRLFQPFDTLHGLDSRSGLGLSVAQRLVELQGGRCFHEANADDGPCLCFTLPAAGT